MCTQCEKYKLLVVAWNYYKDGPCSIAVTGYPTVQDAESAYESLISNVLAPVPDLKELNIHVIRMYQVPVPTPEDLQRVDKHYGTSPTEYAQYESEHKYVSPQ